MDKGECVGGATLSLLHDRSFNYTGDSQAQELCLYLTKAASAPYFEILEKWIYRGIINDPYRWAGGRLFSSFRCVVGMQLPPLHWPHHHLCVGSSRWWVSVHEAKHISSQSSAMLRFTFQNI